MNKANRDTKLHRQGTSNRETAKLKRKASKIPQKETSSKPDEAFPSPETLALIAASVFRHDGEKTPRQAAEYAFCLHDEACKIIGERRAAKEIRGRHASYWASFPQPKTFPATFNDFLRIIVGAPTTADAVKRFRDYLRTKSFFELTDIREAEGDTTKVTEDDLDKCAYQALARYGREGFARFADWHQVAVEYQHYWQGHKSHQARLSAKAPRKKKP